MSFNSWWNGVTASLSNLYASLFSSENVANRATMERCSNTRRDLTFPETANYDLLINLYNNTEPGYKLGAFLCAPIIDIPLNFMGFPHFSFEEKQNEFWEETLNYYNEKFIMIKQQIQLLANLTGTLGIFPYFSSDTGYVKWKFIKSKDISHILIDSETKDYAGFITTINYQFYIKDDSVLYNFEEKTTYTKNKISVIRTGILPPGINAVVNRTNPTGILPISFCNRKIEGEFEGHSEIEKIVPLIKAYAGTNKTAHENVMNIKAKQIQEIDSIADWKKNNGYTNINDISIQDRDFVINKFGKEKTDIIVPVHVIANFTEMLNLDFWGIVQSTGIPEMLMGLQMVGNAASPQTQMSSFLAYRGRLQNQYNNPYNDLIIATMGLIGLAYNQVPPESVIIIWNDIDSLTEIERSTIFSAYAESISKLLTNRAMNRETAYNIIKDLLGDKMEVSYEDFLEAIKEDGELSAFLEQEYMDMRSGGNGEEEEEEEEEENDENN